MKATGSTLRETQTEPRPRAGFLHVEVVWAAAWERRGHLSSRWMGWLVCGVCVWSFSLKIRSQNLPVSEQGPKLLASAFVS